MDVARKIGTYKKSNNVMALQLSRWEQILQQRSAMGKNMGLAQEFTKKVFTLVHDESLNIQTDIMKS
jgi:chorismate mutase